MSLLRFGEDVHDAIWLSSSELHGLELATWARKRVEDEDPFDFAQGRLDEDEDDEDALCWLLPPASCLLPTLVAAEGPDALDVLFSAREGAQDGVGAMPWTLRPPRAMIGAGGTYRAREHAS